GLGTVDRIDDLKVIWPDGTEQTVLDVPVDQVLEIER
ncbi:uncharacterized protein METZ01_LOCUS449737, partial [marine metagenome]